MLGLFGYLLSDRFVGSMAVLVCVAVGYLVWRNLPKHRGQRRDYRERERQRRQFWGWE